MSTRYCSASMRLLGYFPPICDTITVVGDDGNAKEVWIVHGLYMRFLVARWHSLSLSPFIVFFVLLWAVDIFL